MLFGTQFTPPQNPESVRNPESGKSIWIPDSEKTHAISMFCGRIRNPESCRIRSAADSENSSIKSINYCRIRNPVLPTLRGVCPPITVGHVTGLSLVLRPSPEPTQTGPP